MRLVAVELMRFWSRRITWVAVVVVALLAVLFVGIAFTESSAEAPANDGTPSLITDLQCVDELTGLRDAGVEAEFDGLSDAEIEQEYCTYPEFIEDRRFFATLMVADLSFVGLDSEDGRPTWSDYREQRQVSYGVPGEDRSNGVRIEGVLYQEARRSYDGILPVIAVFFLILSVILGGSFVGAEYRAGTVENLLLWEPRRVRVLLMKFVAGFASAAAVMIIVQLILTVLLIGLASVRGTFEGVDGRFWVDLALVIVRSAWVAGCFAVLAMAIAVIAKNTTAAVFALLGWFLVSNIVIGFFARWLVPYELFNNATQFIGEGDVAKFVGRDEIQVFSHSYVIAGLVVMIWTAIPAAISTAVFHRRDMS